MGKWKYLALSSVMALGMSAGLAGCPDDGDDPVETCVDNEDCSVGTCDQGCNRCFEPCPSGGCPSGQSCQAVCAGSANTTCRTDGGTGGDGGGGDGGGGGGPGECAEHVDCVEVAGYCSVQDTCVSNECGTQNVNDCSQCARGPASGARGTNGPVVYAPTQNDLTPGDAATLCRKSAACGANNNVCGFSASYYAAPGQTITSASAYTQKIFLVTANSVACTNDAGCPSSVPLCRGGTCVTRTFENVTLANGTVSWEGCFPAGQDNIGSVLLLLDNGGNHSNSLCFNGTAP